MKRQWKKVCTLGLYGIVSWVPGFRISGLVFRSVRKNKKNKFCCRGNYTLVDTCANTTHMLECE